jgi:hypothetical protein
MTGADFFSTAGAFAQGLHEWSAALPGGAAPGRSGCAAAEECAASRRGGLGHN